MPAIYGNAVAHTASIDTSNGPSAGSQNIIASASALVPLGAGAGAPTTIAILAGAGSPAAPQDFTLSEWARALLVFETPIGLQIAHSLRTDEIGDTIESVNRVEVESIADLAPWLDLIANQGLTSYSMVVRQSVSTLDENYKKASPQTGSYTPYNSADAAPHYQNFELAAATLGGLGPSQNSPYLAQWGVLAKLAGRAYMREQDDRGAACAKWQPTHNCTVLIRWHRPGQVLARYWFNIEGGTQFVDTIVPSARPGVFLVFRQSNDRTVKAQSIIHASLDRFNELEEETYVLSQDNPAAVDIDGRTVTFLTSGYGGRVYAYSSPVAQISRNIRRTTEGFSATIAAARAREAEVASQLASAERRELMGGVYNLLLGAGAAINQQTQANQAQFDRQLEQIEADARAERERQEATARTQIETQTRAVAQAQALALARAQAPGQRQQTQNGSAPVGERSVLGQTPPAVRAAPTPSGTPQSPAAPLPNASGGGGLQPRTVQAYFAWGMALGPNNTRNPRCFSNIFSITYQSAPNGSGDAGRAQAEAGRLASVFRQKCERLGRMDPGTPLANIGLPGTPFSEPYITAEDYQVVLP